jgi:hypothetical protein
LQPALLLLPPTQPLPSSSAPSSSSYICYRLYRLTMYIGWLL